MRDDSWEYGIGDEAAADRELVLELAREPEERGGGAGWLLLGAVIGAAVATRAALRAARAISLHGKSVLVTGGSRGLGLVLARELLREGARVAICARDEAELERARAELATIAGGADVVALRCDVTDRAEVEELVRAVRERLGGVDVRVNNAGVIQVGPAESMTLEDYEEAMRAHFWAPLYTTMAVLPLMRARGTGRIVNISSIGGKISVPHLLPYSASKFALVGLSEGLRAALAKENIVVTTVCPGLMRTGSPRNAAVKGRHSAEYAWFSVAASLPVLTTSAERAARRIVDALKHGDAELVMPGLAWLQVKLHALFPGLASDVVSLFDRALPAAPAEGGETVRRTGAESESRWSPSVLTTLSDRAAARNNEIGSAG